LLDQGLAADGERGGDVQAGEAGLQGVEDLLPRLDTAL
jgi:hypothetical protein